MRKFKVLYNQNQIQNEITTEASYLNQVNHFSIRIVFRGKEQYSIGKRNLTVFPDNFLVLNDGTVYDRNIYSSEPVNTFAILFSPQFLADFRYNLFSGGKDLVDDPFNSSVNGNEAFLESIYPCKGDMKYNLLHLIEHFYDDSDELLLDEYLHHVLFLFYQIYQKEVVNNSDRVDALNRGTREEILKRLCIAKDYILSNYDKPINIKNISHEACLSRAHLFHTFKQVYNCSPHQFLVNARLDNAKYMLKNTSYELAEIVNLVGFTCASTFIKLFKTRFQTTPGNYRHN